MEITEIASQSIDLESAKRGQAVANGRCYECHGASSTSFEVVMQPKNNLFIFNSDTDGADVKSDAVERLRARYQGANFRTTIESYLKTGKMPMSGNKLTDTERVDLLNYLDALNAGIFPAE